MCLSMSRTITQEATLRLCLKIFSIKWRIRKISYTKLKKRKRFSSSKVYKTLEAKIIIEEVEA